MTHQSIEDLIQKIESRVNDPEKREMIAEIVTDVIASGIPGTHIAIHTHNDTENAVAGSLAAVDAGARQLGDLEGAPGLCNGHRPP